MADRADKLLQAIKRLPLVPGVDVDREAAALATLCYFANVNGLTRMQPSRQKNGLQKELVAFANKATKLCQQIDAMHGRAQSALTGAGERHVLAVQDELKLMIGRAVSAAQAAPETTASPSNHRIVPKQVAQVCAMTFRDLTGKRPTLHYDDAAGVRKGPFLAFVTDVFAALEIDASAEHYARDAEAAGDVIGGGGGVTIRRVPVRK